MYSFVAGAGLRSLRLMRSASVGDVLHGAAAEVARRVPDCNSRLRVRVLELPEIGGGWATVCPAVASVPALISEFCSATHAVLVLGQINEAGNPARLAREAFVRGGADAVADLRGVFSALIVERREARLHIVTSVIGCRPLRYRLEAGALCIAPTDLGILAASGATPELELGALATLVVCGWPLGGGTGLKGITECQPHQHVSWGRGQLSLSAARSLRRTHRVEPNDHVRIADKIDEVIEELRDSVEQQLRPYRDQTVRVPLTAGMDSRAVLALVLSLVDRERLMTYARGTSSQDTLVASQLAAQLGLRHETLHSERPSPDTFLANARFLATINNGISNAHTAARPLLRGETSPPVPLGNGGEAFRGHYYKYLWRRRAERGGAYGLASAFLAAPFQRLHETHFATPALDAEPSRALRRAVLSLTPLATDAHDLADLFFFFESLGRWGSTCWRPCLGPTFAPFANHRAFAATLQLPAPIGDHGILPKIIGRFAPPATYWKPINGASLLCLEGPGTLRRATRETLRIGAKLVRESRQRRHPEERGPKQIRLAYLRGSLQDAMQDTLRSVRSIARQLFTPEQLEALLDPKIQQPNHFTIAGAVFSLELWKAALDEVSMPRRENLPRVPSATAASLLRV